MTIWSVSQIIHVITEQWTSGPGTYEPRRRDRVSNLEYLYLLIFARWIALVIAAALAKCLILLDWKTLLLCETYVKEESGRIGSPMQIAGLRTCRKGGEIPADLWPPVPSVC